MNLIQKIKHNSLIKKRSKNIISIRNKRILDERDEDLIVLMDKVFRNFHYDDLVLVKEWYVCDDLYHYTKINCKHFIYKTIEIDKSVLGDGHIETFKEQYTVKINDYIIHCRNLTAKKFYDKIENIYKNLYKYHITKFNN